jgi:putative FmdB family regulatory protein
MPIYEYRCNSCGRRVQLFFRSFSAVADPACPECHSTDLGRVPSRVAVVRSEDAVLDNLSDPSSFENVDYSDPRAVAEWARRMGEATGADMGDDYDEMIDQMARGEEPGGFDSGGLDDESFGADDFDL